MNAKINNPLYLELEDIHWDFIEKNKLEIFSEIREMTKTHYLMNRNIIFAHYEYETIRDAIITNNPFMVISGIMIHNDLHFGHKTLIDQLLWYQQFQNAEIFLPISDIEGWLYHGRTIRESIDIAINEYILDYLTLCDLKGIKHDFRNLHIYSQWANKEVIYYALTISKEINFNEIQSAKRFSKQTLLGKYFFPLVVVGDILHTQLKKYGDPKPVLVPAGTNQLKYLHFSVEVIRRLNKGHNKQFFPPSITYHRMLSGVDGATMQSTESRMNQHKHQNAIFLNDSPDIIIDKICSAKSGGRATRKEQKKLGGFPHICVPYELLLYHCDNDILIQETYDNCITGAILCGDCKKRVAEYFALWIQKFHVRKNKLRGSKNILTFMLSQEILRDTETIPEITEFGE